MSKRNVLTFPNQNFSELDESSRMQKAKGSVWGKEADFRAAQVPVGWKSGLSLRTCCRLGLGLESFEHCVS